MLLHLGSTVRCTDDVLGDLADFVILPAKRRVTHLVVVPRQNRDEARLVPIEVVTSIGAGRGGDVGLNISIWDASELPEVQEFAYTLLEEVPPLESDEWDVGIEDVLTIPTPGYGAWQMGPLEDEGHVSVTYDRVPRGEVEVRHESEVMTADGERIGRLDGLEVEADGSITRLVLERGHLWGRRRIEIPASAVSHFEMDAVALSLSKPEVEALLPVR